MDWMQRKIITIDGEDFCIMSKMTIYIALLIVL